MQPDGLATPILPSLLRPVYRQLPPAPVPQRKERMAVSGAYMALIRPSLSHEMKDQNCTQGLDSL